MNEIEIRRLIIEIRDELSALAKVKAVLDEAQAQFAKRPPNPLEMGGIALNLHDFYNGVENLLRRVALGLGEGLPIGSDWHSRLLKNMALPIPQVRPKVIAEETQKELEEFLRFRHLVRHTYGHDLKWAEVRNRLNSLGPVYKDFVEDIEEFLSFLEAMTES